MQTSVHCLLHQYAGQEFHQRLAAFIQPSTHQGYCASDIDPADIIARDVRKPDFGSVSVFKNLNLTEAKRSNPKFQFPWLFSKPNLSHTKSIFEPFSQHNTRQWHDWHHIDKDNNDLN